MIKKLKSWVQWVTLSLGDALVSVGIGKTVTTLVYSVLQ